MLPGMSLAPVLALFLVSCSCGKPAAKEDKPPTSATAGGEEKIAVPRGSDSAPVAAGAGTDDPRMHLQADEGTITVGKAEAKAGAEATVTVKLAPGAGYHVSMEYPIKLTLEPPAGVKLAKTELTAGGRNKSQGDAQALSEQGLAFAVKATADKAGAFEIKGMFKFGICQKEACHPKKQPITITVAAN